MKSIYNTLMTETQAYPVSAYIMSEQTWGEVSERQFGPESLQLAKKLINSRHTQELAADDADVFADVINKHPDMKRAHVENRDNSILYVWNGYGEKDHTPVSDNVEGTESQEMLILAIYADAITQTQGTLV